ncbi:MAG: hypothetical protein Kow0074_07940 [Candidatus Zixiibacteriota bacterium]
MKVSALRNVLLMVATTLVPMALTVASPDAVRADDFASRNNAANKLVEKGELDQALQEYQRIKIEQPDRPELDYNIGNVYHLKNQFDSAAMEYQDALASLEGPVAPNALYNLGNTLYRMQQYDLAVQSYKQALIENPNDEDAKYNLELALKKLQQQDSSQQQQDQQNQEEQPDSNQHQQDQQQQQPDSTQQQQDQEQQQQPQEQEQDRQSQQEQQPQGEPQQQDAAQQQQQPQQMGMSKEDAERILDALRQRELEVQKQRSMREAVPATTGKDW